ncbi:MAG: hypothetical protein K2W78_10390 [Xanthobacteraceae bacterium]|nr:hypothetical protein [Xanthobacteraceae bacterium]
MSPEDKSEKFTLTREQLERIVYEMGWDDIDADAFWDLNKEIFPDSFTN